MRDVDLVKIGYTKSNNLKRRLSELGTNTPFELDVLLFIEGSQEYEKELHRKYIHLNKKNEWFIYNHEIKEFISNNIKNNIEYIKIKSRGLKEKSKLIHRLSEEDKREFIEMYNNNVSVMDIATRFKLNSKIVTNIASRLKLTRKRLDYRKGINNTPEFYRSQALKRYNKNKITLEELKSVYDKYPPKLITPKYQELFKTLSNEQLP